MTPTPVFTRVQRLASDQLGLGIEEILPTSKFIDDLGADSLDEAELVLAYEEEFRLDIPGDDMLTFVTVADVVTYLEARLCG